MVKQGDHVEEFQEIADVATDKLFTQLYSPEKGIISKIYIAEEEFCQVGQILCEIETEESSHHETNKV